MTHVEVPRRNVAATRRQPRRHRIDLPVLALEDVEAFQSRFSAGDVLRGDPRVFAPPRLPPQEGHVTGEK